MAKTKKSKKLPINWKWVLISAGVGILLVLIVAQFLFNTVMWRHSKETSATRIALLINNALEGLDSLKSETAYGQNGRRLIPEMRLGLPVQPEDVHTVIYLHQRTDTSAGEDESAQVTTRQISSLSRNKVLIGNTVEQVFDNVPEAQACSRGLHLAFKPEDTGLILSGSKRLNDGRTIYVYRESGCKDYADLLDSLAAYLLQAESYQP